MGIPLQSERELEEVKKHVLFELTFDALERDIQRLADVGLKLPDVYTDLLRSVQDRVVADDLILRRLLKNAGIKIIERKRTKHGVFVEYLCRGYKHRCEFTWSYARAEVVKLIRDYLGVLLREKAAYHHAP